MSAKDPERDEDGVETVADGRQSPVASEETSGFPNYVPAGARGATRASDQRTMIADGEYVEASPDEDAGSTVMVKKDYLDDQKTVLRDSGPPEGAGAHEAGGGPGSPVSSAEQSYDPNATVLSDRPPPTATEIGSPAPIPGSDALPRASVRRPAPSGKHAATSAPRGPVVAPGQGAAASKPPGPASPPAPISGSPSAPPRPPKGPPIPAAGLPAPPTQEVTGKGSGAQSLPLRTWVLLLVTAAAAFVVFFGESFGIDVFGRGGEQAETRQAGSAADEQSGTGESGGNRAGDGDSEGASSSGTKASEGQPDEAGSDELIEGLTLPPDTSEARAADLLLQGRKREALAHYVVLSRKHSDSDAFAAMVTILSRQVRQ